MINYCIKIINAKKTIFFIFLFYSFYACLPLMLHGSALFGDSNAYYALFRLIKSGNFPQSPLYVPGFPLFLYLISMITGYSSFGIYTIANCILFIINFIYLIKLLNKYSLLVSKFLIFVLFLSNYILQILYMAHADALALNLILLLFLFISKSSNPSRKDIVIIGLLCGLLIIVKYNYLVTIPVVICWLLYIYGSYKILEKIACFIFFPVIILILWKILNGKYIDHLSSGFRIDVFFDALVTNAFDLGKFFAQFLLTKIIYRITFINVAIIGIFCYLIILLIAFLNLLKRENDKDPFFSFLIFFYLLYPVALILIQSKSGHIEINPRTLFPLFLSSIFIISNLIDRCGRVRYLVYLFWFYAIYIVQLNIKYIYSTIQKPYYTSVNSVLKIKSIYKEKFDFIDDNHHNAVFYTDEENDSRFFIPYNLKMLPYAIRLPKVGKRDYGLNFNSEDSLVIVDNLDHKTKFFLYHQNNTKDTSFKPIILQKGATKLIDHPGCEIYYLPASK